MTSACTLPVLNWNNNSGLHTMPSPGRRYIAVIYSGSSFSTASAEYRELHVYNLEAGERVCATNKIYRLAPLEWSPDGSTILSSVGNEWPAYDYSDITTIIPQTREVQEIWEWYEEGVRVGEVRHLGAGYILNTIDVRYEVWNLPNGENAERFSRWQNGTDSRFKITFSMHGVSSNGHYFACIRESNYTSAVFAVLKWDPIVPTRLSTENLKEPSQLHVYPNPAPGHIQFTLEGQVTMYDLLGREVMPLTMVG